MTRFQSHPDTAQVATTLPTHQQDGRSEDVSGYRLFSAGEAGAAHATAHRMLDQGQIELGHRLLGAWLENHSGAGSEFIHLQWHMAVFEVALGDWDSALARFRKHILPAAATTQDALTDAPALLWRLSLAAPAPVELPWEPMRATALSSMQRSSEPYVELHNLLALAGAGDIESLDRWLQRRAPIARSRSEYLVAQMAVALRAYVAGDHQQAAMVLASVVPFLSEVGGSRAQNQLFEQIERESWRRATNGVSLPVYAEVA
jgi:hypothetical protein